MIVTGEGAAVGLNGGSCIQSSLERTAYPELECQAWNETNAAITAE